MNKRLLKEYVLNRFRIDLIDQISDRSLTQIYKGIDRNTKDFVMIKVCTVTSREHLAQLSQEVSFLLRSASPYIVSLKDASLFEGVCIMVMDAYPFTLLELVNSGHNLSAQEAFLFVRSVYEALAYAGRRGLIAHRDIKPSNIFCCYNRSTQQLMHFVLADFGCALFENTEPNHSHSTASLRPRQITVGTPLYCAPEQERNPQQARFEADMYALGITIYESLTHCVAHPSHTCTDYRYRSGVDCLKPDNTPQLSDIERAQLNKLIQQLTKIDPDLRPRSPQELKDVCRHVCAIRSVHAPEGRLQKSRKTLLLCVSFLSAVCIGITCIILRYLQ